MKTGSIDIYSSNLKVKDFTLILNQLLLNGWSANKNGLIVYVIDDSYEPLSMTFNKNSLNAINRKLCDNMENGLNASIDLVLKDNEGIINLHVVKDGNLRIGILENIIYISDTDIIDFSWYIEKLKGVFSILNFYRLICSFD
jgi:hypothetical protein